MERGALIHMLIYVQLKIHSKNSTHMERGALRNGRPCMVAGMLETQWRSQVVWKLCEKRVKNEWRKCSFWGCFLCAKTGVFWQHFFHAFSTQISRRHLFAFLCVSRQGFPLDFTNDSAYECEACLRAELQANFTYKHNKPLAADQKKTIHEDYQLRVQGHPCGGRVWGWERARLGWSGFGLGCGLAPVPGWGGVIAGTSQATKHTYS